MYDIKFHIQLECTVYIRFYSFPNCLQINSAAELLHMLEFGNKSRTQHPTDANAESSRSHAVFQVY
jgi:hypothetical protein